MKKVVYLFLVSISLLLIGCSNNSKKSEEKSVSEPVKQEKVAKAEPESASKSEKKEEKSLMDKTKEMGSSAATTVQDSAKAVVEKTTELAKQAQNSELVQKVAQKTKEGVAALSAMASSGGNAAHTEQSGNAKELFTKCAGCHGNKAQNKALGVSHVIAGWDAKKIENALNGYKTGTYGGSMKSIMKGQVIMLKDSDIKALAEYISKL